MRETNRRTPSSVEERFHHRAGAAGGAPGGLLERPRGVAPRGAGAGGGTRAARGAGRGPAGRPQTRTIAFLIRAASPHAVISAPASRAGSGPARTAAAIAAPV